MRIVGSRISLSIMPSLRCNLECPHCMYDASKHRTERIDLDQLRTFLSSVDWDLVNTVGFYGGEPSIDLPLYEACFDMLPKGLSLFTITNGTWSTSRSATKEFILFCLSRRIRVFVSSTRYHTKHQNEAVVHALERNGHVSVKPDDLESRLLPMGRSRRDAWICSRRCKEPGRETRLAVRPDGTVIFQQCDGAYPEVGTFRQPFAAILSETDRAKMMCPGFGWVGR